MSVPAGNGVVHERDHIVAFYGEDADLVDAVAAFLGDGLRQDGTAIVVATAGHRVALERALIDLGLAPDALTADGRYRSLDAADMLMQFMRDGQPDPEAFASAIGPLVADAARGGASVRIFGEMVALLWETGNVSAAIDLESLWNDLASTHPFTLYCAYPTTTVQTDGDLAAAKQVCDRHSSVVSLSGDVHRRSLFAVRDENDRFAQGFVPAPTVLHAVRGFVADVLDDCGADQLVDDALIVACELATNAMIHARSPFWLSITRSSDAIEIAVRDASTERPEERPMDPNRIGGRGIPLINRLAREWGTRDERDGKTIWVELPAG